MLWAAFAIVFLLLWALFYACLPALRYVGRRLTHLVARSARVNQLVARHREWLPVVVILVAGALLTVWAGDEFLDLAESVRAKNATLQRIDGGVHDWAVAHRSAPDTLFFIVMTNVGSPGGVVVPVGIIGIVMAFLKRWRWVAYLAVTVGGGELLDVELKSYFARARPAVAEMLKRAHGYSFPSGHAMGSTVALGALVYLAYRAAKSWPAAAAALAFGVTFVLSVSLSRVYLGVHWISDVVAGMVIGLLWVTVTTCAYETVRRIRHLRGLRASRLPSEPSAASTGPGPSARS